MAAPEIKPLGNHAYIATWTLTSDDAQGDPIGKEFADYVDRTVQVIGTFGGGTVKIEGRIIADGSAWMSLSDPQGTPLEVTDATLKAISEFTRETRVVLDGGTQAEVVVAIAMRRSRGGKEV